MIVFIKSPLAECLDMLDLKAYGGGVVQWVLSHEVLTIFIHLRSTLLCLMDAAGLLGALPMNSKALISTSLMPLWHLDEKWSGFSMP